MKSLFAHVLRIAPVVLVHFVFRYYGLFFLISSLIFLLLIFLPLLLPRYVASIHLLLLSFSYEVFSFRIFLPILLLLFLLTRFFTPSLRLFNLAYISISLLVLTLLSFNHYILWPCLFEFFSLRPLIISFILSFLLLSFKFKDSRSWWFIWPFSIFFLLIFYIRLLEPLRLEITRRRKFSLVLPL